MQLNNIGGHYCPSFFYMVLDTNEDINIALKKYTQTFIHEFIHYLQDLILPYNIRLNLTNLALFGNIHQSVIETGKLVRPFDKWNENSKLLREQRDFTLGKPKFLTQKPCIEAIEKDYFIIPSTEAKVYKYTLVLKQPRKKYHVSAIDMLEYIAHKIETKHYEDNAFQTPYKTIDYIFDFYQLSDIPFDVRLCIVEYCLYNDNPIHVLLKDFFDSNIIKNNKNIFTDYTKCYDLLLHHSSWTATGGFNETIISKTIRRLEDFKVTLTNHFSAPQFNTIIHWLETVADYVGRRFVNRFIFSDIYHMNFQELLDSISNIIDSIGLPMILNKANKCISLLPGCNDPLPFIQFYVLQNFLIYIESKKQSCPIYDLCIANAYIAQNSCKTSPCLSINNDVDCPYSLFLRSYSLINVT